MKKRRNLTGQRFGKLTVIGPTEEREDNYVLWRCRCDCGKELLVNTKKLRRGTARDCGCVPKTTARNGNRAEDLTGRVYGSLTVLRRAENHNGRTAWVCRCSCGKEKTVTAHDLKMGKVKSCGCLSLRRYKVDLTGQRFGRLTALYPTERRDSKGSVYWHCVCDCGKEKDVTESGLVHGNYRSCGCLRGENQQEIGKKLTRVDGTCVEILENRKYRKDNKSGFRGVYRMKNSRYRADIGFKGRRFYLGSYTDYQEAVRARLEAEELIHGGFLRAWHEWKERADKDPRWGKEHPLRFEVEKKDGGLEVLSGDGIPARKDQGAASHNTCKK